MDTSKPTPIHKSFLPEQLEEETRKIIESHLDANAETHEAVDKTGYKVTPEICELMQELYAEGMTLEHISQIMPVESQSTVLYHVNEECSHDKSKITRDECGWMIYHASNGAKVKDLAEKYDVSRRTVSWHINGNCTHDHGLGPVDARTVKSDKTKSSGTEKTCEICGDEFIDNTYKGKRFCSKKCSAENARREFSDSLKNADTSMSHSNHITSKQCRVMNFYRSVGMKRKEIADKMGVCGDTVTKHTKGKCKHKLSPSIDH